MLSPERNRRASESGAVAVIVGVLAMVLFAGAAVAVDLGNAVVRKRGLQGQADFSALAGGSALPATTGDASDPVVAKVAEYLLSNAQPDDDAMALPDLATLKADLVDADPNNGNVTFVTPNRVRVTAPRAHVSFGFAAALGFSSAEVSATAEVEIGSPSKALPFYVSESCSYLEQTIVNAPSGHEDPRVPVLTPAGDPTYAINLTLIDPDETPLDTPVTGAELVAQGGNSMDGVTMVGFTTENRGSGSVHVEVPVTPPGSGSSVLVDVPDTVYEQEALWYVRVFKGGKWSEDSVAFKVGEPPLYCEGMASGNFGALVLSRDDTTHGSWVAMNAIKGIMHDVGVYPPPAPRPCEGHTDASMAYSPSGPFPAVKPVNCVTTEPGTVQQATQGFILGETDQNGEFHPGSLISDESTCDPHGGSDPRHVTIAGRGSFNINDDVLTCFFNDPTTTVSEVSAETMALEDAISPDIFKSPRFFWIPVLSDDPSLGRSGSWPILTFRGAFLTGQPPTASQIDPKTSQTLANENGLLMDTNGVSSVQAVMINENSLPDTADVPGDIIAYVGVGPKIIRLVE